MPDEIPKSAPGCKPYNEVEANAAWLDYSITRASHGKDSAEARAAFDCFLEAYTRGSR